MNKLHLLFLLLLVLQHAASGAMPAPISQDSYAKSASARQEACVECYEVDSESVSLVSLISANAHTRLVTCGIQGTNSFEQDTLVHTRILTDQGYQKQLKRIADIQVGNEVLAWDEVKAFDIAQAKENLKLQANLQAKSADSRQETCAECYEKSSESSKPSTMQNALLRSTAGRGMTGNSEA